MDALGRDDPRSVAGYRLLGRLGAGGMGRVYLALSPGGRQVAVKVVRPEFVDDPGFRERFAREVAAARSVSGVFTAPVLDADPAASPPWLVTGYVPGPSLTSAVQSYGPLPVDSCELLAAGLAEALAAIHRAGLIHRDLKPSNVLLASDGPRVIDFGIVRAVDAGALTRAGSLVGTPSYMSPEQIHGQDVGPAGDVFSLGAVVYFAATGHTPFGQDSLPAIFYRVANTDPDFDVVPPRLRPLVQACLAKDPSHRPTTAALLSELAPATSRLAADSNWLPPALAEAVNGRRAQATREEALPQPPAPANGNGMETRPASGSGSSRWKVAAGAAAVAALLAGAVVTWQAWPSGDDDGGTVNVACGASDEEFDDSDTPEWTSDPGQYTESGEVTDGVMRVAAKDGADWRADITEVGLTAPRLYKAVTADFTLETTVRVEPKYSYQSAGLFLVADAKNYIRLERGFAAFGAIVFEHSINGKHTKVRSPFAEKNPVQDPIKTDAPVVGLRLKRTAATIEASWRPGNSGDWQPVGTITSPADRLTASLAVLNRSQTPNPDPAKSPLRAEFEYAHITC